MEKRELTCIGCPLGCSITVTLENGEIKDVAGYTCKRGHDYARKEVTNPTRIVTSTVRSDRQRDRRSRRQLQDGAGHPEGQDLRDRRGAPSGHGARAREDRRRAADKRRRNGRRYRCNEKCTVIGNEVRRKFTNPFGFVHSSDMIGRYTHTRKQANLFFPLFSFFFLFYTNRTGLPHTRQAGSVLSVRFIMRRLQQATANPKTFR